MGILDWFKRKSDSETTERYELTEQDRSKSLERRRISAEMRRVQEDIKIKEAQLKLKELEDQLAEYDDPEEEEEESSGSPVEQALTMLALQMLNKNHPQVETSYNGNSPQQTETSQPSHQLRTIDLSDEQIEALYKENKKYIKFARAMTDEQIKGFLLNRMPDLSEQSISKIISRVRG